MSVLACDRPGCDHIMCDRLIQVGPSRSHGKCSYYVCDVCFGDLMVLRDVVDWEDVAEDEVEQIIHEFMENNPIRDATYRTPPASLVRFDQIVKGT